MDDSVYLSLLLLFIAILSIGRIVSKRKKKSYTTEYIETQRISVSSSQSFCHNCGAELPSDVGFCPECGAAVNAGRSISVSERRRICPKCGGAMTIQTVVESKKVGCFTILLYILLTVTVLGILIVILLSLRKKTETVTYAVCQSCGYRERA